jgi:hypothetical protein
MEDDKGAETPITANHKSFVNLDIEKRETFRIANHPKMRQPTNEIYTVSMQLSFQRPVFYILQA